MNLWVERLGWTLLHFVWEGALIAGIYAAGRRVLNARGPSARYLLACGALAAMAAAPAVTLAVLSDLSVQVASTAWTGGSAAHFQRSGVPSGSSMLWTAGGETSTPPMVWVVLFWLAGAGVFSIRLMGGWWMSMRVRSHRVREAPAEWSEAFARIGALAGVSRPVRLLVSAIVKVPMVVGWLRPVVLVPVGAFTGLPPEHVEALLAHELAHIRRQDYLVNILQSIAEALLFYHPAVWWVSRHIRIERELCCDDVAAAASGDVFTYASALAELESLRPDRLDVAMAASGGLLGDRIARLLGHERAQTRPGPGVIVSAVLLVFTACAVFGQTVARPEFDVASIRVSKNPAPGGDVEVTPGRFRGKDLALQWLILVAYRINSSNLSGDLPNWTLSERYDIDAKTGNADSEGQILLALQNLLRDRFQLRLHRETKEEPVYFLIRGKNGIKMPPGSCVTVKQDLPNECYSLKSEGLTQTLDWRGVRMSDPTGVAYRTLTGHFSGINRRPVIDKTGLNGTFDVHLRWARDPEPPTVAPPGDTVASTTPAEPRAPSIFDAMEEQLGLKLESGRGPVEHLVVDHVERPSEN